MNENLIGRRSVYTDKTLPPGIVEIVVKIIEKLISTLALVTKKLKERHEVSSSSLTRYLTQRDPDELKSLLRGKAANEDIEEAPQSVD